MKGNLPCTTANRKTPQAYIYNYPANLLFRNTLAVPCMRIGSAVNAVHADIYALTLRS